MELKKAIKEVAKACPRVKAGAMLQYIRLLPGNDNGIPSRLFASNGAWFILVNLDEDCKIPNVLLESDILVKASKTMGALEIEETGYGHIELLSRDKDNSSVKLLYKMEATNFDYFPVVPPIPESFVPVADWNLVGKVLHAAALEKDNPELAFIHFAANGVESTDKSRLARVEISGPWDGAVPSNLFKSWPKKEKVSVVFTDTYAFFKIGNDILRIAFLPTSDFPSTKKLIPGKHTGPFVLVPIPDLRNAVARGAEVSELGLLSLEFDSEKVLIKAWQEKESGKAYEAVVDVFHSVGGVGKVLVNGKKLAQSLKEVDTPNVKLGYESVIGQPLRIESGAYLACLWQVVC